MTIQRQHGQILILAGLFVTALALVVFALFRAGWTTTEKTRLQATADAAAHYAAMLQARDLNLQAVLNRAMIANQVTVAQSVAISSYLQVNQQMWYWLENTGDVAQYIPYVGSLISKGTDAAKTVFGTLNKQTQQGLSLLTSTTNRVNSAASLAGKAWHWATLQTTPFAVQAQIQTNDPQADIPLLGLAWLGADLNNQGQQVRRASLERAEKQSHRGADRQAADQFRQTVLDSRGSFTRARNRHFWNLNLVLARTRMAQRGGTELGTAPGKRLPYYSWSAADTVSLQGKSFFCWFQKCTWKEWVPAAWGRQASWHPNTFHWPKNRTLYGGATGVNRKAWNAVVTRDRVNGGYMEGTGNSIDTSGHYKVQRGVVNNGFGKALGGTATGMKDFYYWDAAKTAALCDQTLTLSQSQGCPIRVFITRDALELTPTGTQVLSSEQAATPARLQALAAAAAVFEPPLAGPSRPYALASAYQPYWTARLIAWPSEKDRLAAHAIAAR